MKDEPDWSRVPAQVQRLLRSCLEKDPRNRLRDIGDAWRLLDQEPESATVLSARPWSWVMAGVFAVIAAVALWALWRSPKSVDRPLMRLDVSLGPDAIPGAGSAVAISPDGTRIVFPIRGTDGKQLLATRLLDQAAITPLPGTQNGNDAFFSPDGQWIGFLADRKLKKVSLRGGPPVTLADATAFAGASWAENGDLVAGLNVAGGLLSIPASGGSPRSVTDSDKEQFTHLLPQVLPGGNTVLFTAQKVSSVFDDANIEAVSLKSGTVKTLLSGGYFGRYLATNGSTGHLLYLRQGELYAVAFDPVRLVVRGMPEPILEGVGPFDFSRNGTFVYTPRIAPARKWPMVLLDSSGKTEPLVTTPGDYTAPAFSGDGKRLALMMDSGGIFVDDLQRDALSRLPTGAGVSYSPIWSRDGDHLVFVSSNAAGSRLNWMRGWLG
jgi:eukaryotic-like serine/threonine-protein kinase